MVQERLTASGVPSSVGMVSSTLEIVRIGRTAADLNRISDLQQGRAGRSRYEGAQSASDDQQETTPPVWLPSMCDWTTIPGPRWHRRPPGLQWTARRILPSQSFPR